MQLRMRHAMVKLTSRKATDQAMVHASQCQQSVPLVQVKGAHTSGGLRRQADLYKGHRSRMHVYIYVTVCTAI